MNFISPHQQQYLPGIRQPHLYQQILPLKNKIHISLSPCNILYLSQHSCPTFSNTIDPCHISLWWTRRCNSNTVISTMERFKNFPHDFSNGSLKHIPNKMLFLELRNLKVLNLSWELMHRVERGVSFFLWQRTTLETSALPRFPQQLQLQFVSLDDQWHHNKTDQSKPWPET